jgi:hypothetical protein
VVDEEGIMDSGTSYVWYVAYASNLFEERFLHYIRGGGFRLGGSYADGCTDTTPPVANKQIRIPHRLYFAKSSSRWGGGGVAFVDPDREKDEGKWVILLMALLMNDRHVAMRTITIRRGK